MADFDAKHDRESVKNIETLKEKRRRTPSPKDKDKKLHEREEVRTCSSFARYTAVIASEVSACENAQLVTSSDTMLYRPPP